MCLRIALLLIIPTILGVSVRGQLQLSPSVNETEKYVNDSYVVTCHGEGAEGTTWRGPDDRHIPRAPGRVHTEEREAGAVSLVFEAVARSDKGFYKCSSRINGRPDSASFRLNVVKPISFVSGLGEQSLTEHQNGKVKCELTGDPPPSIVWQINGTSVLGKRYRSIPGGLHISDVTVEDQGVYACRAYQVTSQTSTMREQFINVTVHYKPKWRSTNQDIWYSYIGTPANLTCQVDANPEAEFTWTKGNRTILDGSRMISEPNKSILQVNVSSDLALGEYECKAWNRVGSVWRGGTLKEGVKPDPPDRVTLERIAGRDVVLGVFWGATTEPHPGIRVEFQESSLEPVLWQHPHYQDLLTGHGPYTIKDLKEKTQYVFRVATLGAAGLSDFTEEFRFTTSNASVLKCEFLLFMLIFIFFILHT